MIYTAIEILNRLKQIPHGFINHTTWVPQSLPLVSLDREIWDAHQLVPWTGSEPVWVELTINNLDSNGHPFHLVRLSLHTPSFSKTPPADKGYSRSTASISTSLHHTKARVAGITTVHLLHRGLPVAVHSTSRIRYKKTPSMCRHGDMWL
jgi:hypothetical protein